MTTALAAEIRGGGNTGTNTGNGNEVVTPTNYSGTTLSTSAAIGDILLNDGTIVTVANAGSMTDEQKAKAEAVVFYVGSADSALGNRTLAVNVKNSGSNYDSSSSYEWHNTDSVDITAIACSITSTQPASGTYYTYTDNDSDNSTHYITGDLDGSDNWAKVQETDQFAEPDDDYIYYPAFNYVNTVLGEEYYLPSVAELYELYKNITTVNASIAAVGGTTLSSEDYSTYYWSSSQCTEADAYYVKFSSDSDGGAVQDEQKHRSHYVCGVRAFTN